MVSICAAIVVLGFGWAGLYLQLTWPYWLISVGGSAVYFVWSIATVNLDNAADCWETFKSNGRLHGCVGVGIFASYCLKTAA
jgi:4-hydroxybenzoate polyprenyltransferase